MELKHKPTTESSSIDFLVSVYVCTGMYLILHRC